MSIITSHSCVLVMPAVWKICFCDAALKNCLRTMTRQQWKTVDSLSALVALMKFFQFAKNISQALDKYQMSGEKKQNLIFDACK